MNRETLEVQTASFELDIQPKKKEKLSKLVSTFFKNALRSNLDLTSLADTKAGILISINGFILTVSVTASGFVTHNSIMTYAFISIILTSLGSIILAVMAVKPRYRDHLVEKEHLEGYESLLYYQDMADLEPKEYTKKMKKALFSSEQSIEEMVIHLHILGSEIKKKYFWLKQAYTFFSVGLVLSASLIIYGLLYVENKSFYKFTQDGLAYSKKKFYNIFEPSGATTMPDGNVIIVEDAKGINSIKLLETTKDNVVEIGNIYMNKEIKNIFKKDIEDLEAITSDSNTVFAITSHTLTKSNEKKSSRERFIMFTYEDSKITNFHLYGNLKNDLYKNFGNYYDKRLLSSSDINIEGLAFDNTKNNVLLGFAYPTINSKAIIIEIQNPKDVFLKDEKPLFSKPIELDLGGLGIRDITYDPQKKGYWILAGSINERGNSFELWFWDKYKSKVHHIKNHPDLGYAEGITVIHKDSEKLSSLLIVEDNGIKPNKPADYTLIKRNSL